MLVPSFQGPTLARFPRPLPSQMVLASRPSVKLLGDLLYSLLNVSICRASIPATAIRTTSSLQRDVTARGVGGARGRPPPVSCLRQRPPRRQRLRHVCQATMGCASFGCSTPASRRDANQAEQVSVRSFVVDRRRSRL